MITGFVQGQALRLNAPVVAADTLDYLTAQFVFRSADWRGMEKWAHFAKGGTVYDVRLTDDKIRREDHLNLGAGEWKVYIHGNRFADVTVVERITTAEDVLCVVPTGALNGEPFPEMPASVTEQILARLENVEQNGGGGSGGGISHETDPTVPDWAKEPEKPKYTAAEVGAASVEQFNQLSGEIAVLDESKSDRIIETATGEVLVLSDSADAPLRGLVVYGKSTQDGTPTPDAPVPIVSVGGGGVVDVGVYVENLLVQTLPIATPDGLRGIPVESGGNYTDASDQQWVCDEIDFVRGVKLKRVLVYACKGTEKWVKYGDKQYGISLSELKIKTNSRVICDRFKRGFSTSEGYCFIGASGIAFNTGYETIGEWKTYLSDQLANGTPVTFCCESAEPIETPLTAEELAAHRVLHTHYPNTTIYADDNAGLSVQYKADTKGYIDKKFNELAAVIVNN